MVRSNTFHVKRVTEHDKFRKRFALEVVHQAQIVDEGVEHALFQALSAVPREQFIPERYLTRATENVSLPVGFNQFCEQPSAFIRMASIIGVTPGMRVLEVGTGSGYSAALLSKMGIRVCSIEKEGLLAQQARKRLDRLGFSNVLIRTGNGLKGWKDYAPFDGIFLTVAIDEHPYELVKQLSPEGGLMVYPLETVEGQRLTLVQKEGDDVKIFTLEETAYAPAVL